jgi:hypothetical protein
VYRGERGVGHLVNAVLVSTIFVNVFGLRAFGVDERGAVGISLRLLGEADEGVLGRGVGAGQHLQLVGLGEHERVGVTARVPLPLAEGDEARAALEALFVIRDDAPGLPSRDEPLDDDRLARPLGVARRHLEDVERRRLRPAVLPDLEAAGHAHVQV